MCAQHTLLRRNFLSLHLNRRAGIDSFLPIHTNAKIIQIRAIINFLIVLLIHIFMQKHSRVPPTTPKTINSMREQLFLLHFQLNIKRQKKTFQLFFPTQHCRRVVVEYIFTTSCRSHVCLLAKKYLISKKKKKKFFALHYLL